MTISNEGKQRESDNRIENVAIHICLPEMCMDSLLSLTIRGPVMKHMCHEMMIETGTSPAKVAEANEKSMALTEELKVE